MSLSQKHSGLILVPWFNTAEWLHVYFLTYSNDVKKQLEALKLLKIWKVRTPILPAGVEGTLILLDALLTEEHNFSPEQVAQLYSVGLMRFLNLSAANSDKQGSFMKTSAKNDLPKWLVNLRHDIAHGHQIPSIFNLKMGLNFGFIWLKEKYWESQRNSLNDYYADSSLTTDNFETSIKTYITLNLAFFEKTDLNEEFVGHIRDKIHKKYKRQITHSLQIFEILEETLRQFFELDLSQKNIDEFLKLLVSHEALLKNNFQEEEGNEKIEQTFRNIWKGLLNLLHQYKLISNLIMKLFEIITNVSCFENTKKMAAIWIKELLVSLDRLRENNIFQEDIEYLELHSSQYTYLPEMLEFQDKVLLYPNKYSKYFLDTLLKYNSNNEAFNSDVMHLMYTGHLPQNITNMENQIFRVSHLENEGITFEDLNILINSDHNSLFTNKPDNKQLIKSTKKWEQIEDNSIFKNCPIGILPHQQDKKRPVLLAL